MIKGKNLPGLYDTQETIPHLMAIFRRDETVPFESGKVDDSNPCRVIWVSLATWLAWDASHLVARDIAKTLNDTPNYQKGEVWWLRTRFAAVDSLVGQVECLYQRATFNRSSRFQVRHDGAFLIACQEAHKTLEEYNKTLTLIESMLKEAQDAVAATLSPVR